MKTIIFFTLALTITAISFAQNGINYKAVIKDTDGNVIANQSIMTQISILRGASQINVYTETHSPMSDDNGIIILNIGEGDLVSGSFSDISWGSNDHFLNIQIDIGSGLTDIGTLEFKSVPYAKFSERTNVLFMTDVGAYTATNVRNDWVDTGLGIEISQSGNYFISYGVSIFSLLGNTTTLSSDYTLTLQIIVAQNNTTTVIKTLNYNALQVPLPNGGNTYLWRFPEILTDSTIGYLEEGGNLSVRLRVSDNPTGSVTSNYAISTQKLNLFKLTD